MKAMVLIFALTLALVAGNAVMAQGNADGLVKNGGFEEGEQGALPVGCGIDKEGGAAGTVAIDNTQSHSGKQSILIHMTSVSGFSYLHPCLNATLKPGSYIFRVWAKMEPEQSFHMQIYDSRQWSDKKPVTLQLKGKGVLSKECRANSKEWSKFEIEVDVTEEFSASIQIGLTKPGKLWLDDIEIVPSGRATTAVGIKQSEQNLEIQNSKIVLNIAKGNPGVVLSYKSEGRLCSAVSLNAFQQDNAASVSSFKVVKNTPELAVVEVVYSFVGGQTVTVTYSVKNGFEYIEAESDFAQGKAVISATMKSEVLVLPDFLADSMVFYPESLSTESMSIPVDNHLLVNLLDNGNAMLTLLWDSTQMSITETKKSNLFDSVTLSANAKTRFWIGALAANGIWYKAAEKLNTGSFTVMNWTPPFQAEWKLTTFLTKGFHTDRSTCESWTFAQRVPKESNVSWIKMENEGIGITKPSAWQAWASGVGVFIYPCYFEGGKAFAKKPLIDGPAKNSVVGDSPCLIYGLNGNTETPSGITMPKNMLKRTLSKEINNHLEAMDSPKNKYPTTCSITAKVEKIFYRSESVKEGNQIKSDLGWMNMFVLTVRERIEEYVAWQQKMQKMLEEQKLINPQLNPLLNELEKELAQIALAYAKAKDNMKTPPYCATLTEKVIELIDSKLSDEEKEEQCKALGRQIRTIGASQDSFLGTSRSIVKACRQYATMKLMTSSNAAEIELLNRFRLETGLILNNRLTMEGK